MDLTKEFICSNYRRLPRDQLRKLLACLDDDRFWEVIETQHGQAAIQQPAGTLVYHCVPTVTIIGAGQASIKLSSPVFGHPDAGYAGKTITFSLPTAPTRGLILWMAVYLHAKAEDVPWNCPVFATKKKALHYLESGPLAEVCYGESSNGSKLLEVGMGVLGEDQTFLHKFAVSRIVMP